MNTFIRDRLTYPGSSEESEPVAPAIEGVTLVINKHMPVILVSVGTNIIDDALIDGRSGINGIAEDKRWRLEQSKSSFSCHSISRWPTTL